MPKSLMLPLPDRRLRLVMSAGDTFLLPEQVKSFAPGSRIEAKDILNGKVEASVNAAALSAELFLSGSIQPWNDFSAKYIKPVLDDLAVKGIKQLNIKLNTVGGSVFEGNLIFNLITSWRKANSVNVDVEVIGMAASMGSIVMFAGGKKPKIAARSMVMVHGPRISLDEVTVEEIESTLNLMTQIRDSFVSLYSMMTGNSKKVCESWVTKDTWFNAEKAVELGLASEVTNSELLENSITREMVAQMHFQSAEIPDDFFKSVQPVNANNMTDETKNKDKDKDKKDGASADSARMEAIEKQNELLTQQLKENKAESLVANHAGRLKLTAESQASYKKLAIADFDATKALLESMKEPVTISNQIDPAAAAAAEQAEKETREKWTFTDWAKKDAAGLAEMRDKNRDAYAALFKAQYGKMPW